MANALKEGRRAIEIYPKNVPQRNNVGLLRDVRRGLRDRGPGAEGGPRAEPEVRHGIRRPRPRPSSAPANRPTLRRPGRSSQELGAVGGLGLGRRARRPRPLSRAASADAKAILESRDRGGPRAEERGRRGPEARDAGRDALLLTGKTAAAVAAAERALATSTDDAVAVSAALVLARAGERQKALAIAEAQEKKLEADPQMYGKVIRAAVERQAKNYREAIALLKEAQKLANSWLVHRELATATSRPGASPRPTRSSRSASSGRARRRPSSSTRSRRTGSIPPLYYDLGPRARRAEEPGRRGGLQDLPRARDGPGRPPRRGREEAARRRLRRGGGRDGTLRRRPDHLRLMFVAFAALPSLSWTTSV